MCRGLEKARGAGGGEATRVETGEGARTLTGNGSGGLCLSVGSIGYYDTGLAR